MTMQLEPTRPGTTPETASPVCAERFDALFDRWDLVGTGEGVAVGMGVNVAGNQIVCN